MKPKKLARAGLAYQSALRMVTTLETRIAIESQRRIDRLHRAVEEVGGTVTDVAGSFVISPPPGAGPTWFEDLYREALRLAETKLWLLRPIFPWKAPYEKAGGFVVRASDEDEARSYAADQAGDEGSDVWIDGNVTACTELAIEGSRGVVLRDFASG